MNKETNQIYQNVMKGKELEESLPRFFNCLTDRYHTMAAVRLALHYYSFYESYCDDGEQWEEAVKAALKQLNLAIGELIAGDRSTGVHEEAVRAVDMLRNDIIHRMKLLTSYSDVCTIREYLLNRIEYRFKPREAWLEDEEFAREVLRFIFETQENAVINDRIREVIGQLPVRMTKLKFFDLIRGSMHEYVGAGQDTLESYLYMLRSSSLLELPKEADPLYPLLWDMKQSLLSQDYQNMSAEEYERAVSELMKTAAFLEKEINVYYSLQEIVNEVYTLLLCDPYAGMSAPFYEKEEEAAFQVIRGIYEEFEKGLKQEPSVGLIECFGALEGLQENLGYDLIVLEEALYQADLNHRKLAEGMLVDKHLNLLLLAKDLLSNSLFIDFYEIKSSLPVSEERAGEEADKLIDELTQLFERCDRRVSRAIMANLLDKMPVFFNGHKEVMDYVRNAMEKCTDPAEKAACFEIIMAMINE